MEFKAETYPNLPAKVHARVMRISGEITQEAEDAAIADVLEGLLAHPGSTASRPTPSNASRPVRSQTAPGDWK